jgi:glycosyltransferase involved in cell wall biosynthesis
METEAAVELSIVVPVFEEESVVPVFLERIIPVLESVTPDFEILFCMDPGRDNTRGVICDAIAGDRRTRLIVLSRRFGQPAATIAGIESCRGAACIVIDIDLQDPPEVIPELVAKWREGFDVVYAQRIDRLGETFVKRAVSHLGYKLINYVADVYIPPDTGDFRLISRRVIEALRGLKETHGFLRGLVAYTGYNQTSVRYHRAARQTGRSKYNRFTGSIRIGMNGVVAFSSKILSLSSVLGLLAAGFSFFVAVWYVLQKLLFHPEITPGLPTTVIVVTFLGGIQLISLGILGEYVGRIYEEVRCRPKYLIAERINFSD